MANESVLIFETERPIPFTVANATGIEKGAILKMTDPRTAIINSADNDAVAGIAAREKIASDGRTRLSVYRDGIFDITASGNITVGDAVAIDASVNHVRAAVNTSGANILGFALETATTGEVIQVELKPMKG